MRRALLAFAVPAALAIAAMAMSGTDQLVGEYEAIQERPGWPKGVLEMLQDPGRKVGWQHWFTELPNDVESYAFAVRTTADAQRLIDAFAKVADPKKRLGFHPGRGPRGLGDFRPAAKGREWGAVLAVSNRDAVARANEVERKKGKMEVYSASPTCLDIFLGTADVDLAALKIPREVMVAIATESAVRGRDYERQVRMIREFKARVFPK